MSEYDPKSIEPKWQDFWITNKVFKTEPISSKPKYYVLDMFPYPSGSGLHVGHPEGYTATDIIARYKRMKGFNVLHPMGWDAFGLPAEQYAIKTGTHPKDTTEKNITTFRRQIQELGLSYDWDREINTTDPSYYKWTQWIFIQLYKRGLAYESHEPVNWCEQLGTILANEEVKDGKSEVGGFPVEKKLMRQWVLKITEYAERLLVDLEGLDWPESIKDMQRNWIGKSQGADIHFAVKGHPDEKISVFSTRPDTLFGATFMVLAPEHPLVDRITTAEKKTEVDAYVTRARNRSERERLADTSKSGVFLGAYGINPANQEELPIYVSDYVLMSYGHGAVMAVPGHDQRDHDFAKAYKLPIKQVVTGEEEPISEKAHAGGGKLCHSDFLDGMSKDEAIGAMCAWLEKHGAGTACVTYKLRDWLFSRQRFWGEPIPICHDKDGVAHLIDESELPLVLPDLSDFKPPGGGESPLASAGSWLETEVDGMPCRRETNTMPQWAGSCWYYLRFIDPCNTDRPWDQELEKAWMPVDLYVGGAEHAVLHLLYARFWHKVLYDLGYVSTKEPFQKLVNQGMILGENGEKMSKSRGNVVNPDQVIAEWGADALRLYEMFMGPLQASKPWQTNGIAGCHRFLKRAWRLIVDAGGAVSSKVTDGPSTEEFLKTHHKMIKKVTQDTENMDFNTAISCMMEYVNEGYKQEFIAKSEIEGFVLVLSPYAPHMAEELWSLLGHENTLAYEPWPDFEESLTLDDTVTISVQVAGKMRGTLEVAKNSDKSSVIAAAKEIDSVAKHLDGQTIRKEIYVPGKIVNFVI